MFLILFLSFFRKKHFYIDEKRKSKKSNKYIYYIFFSLTRKCMSVLSSQSLIDTHTPFSSNGIRPRGHQRWDFLKSEISQKSFSYQTVPPNKCFLKLKLIFEFFLKSEIFLKCACHQHFLSLTWGIKAEIFQKMLRLGISNLR